MSSRQPGWPHSQMKCASSAPRSAVSLRISSLVVLRPPAPHPSVCAASRARGTKFQGQTDGLALDALLFGPADNGRESRMAGSLFKLETTDGAPAEPSTLSAAGRTVVRARRFTSGKRRCASLPYEASMPTSRPGSSCRRTH